MAKKKKSVEESVATPPEEAAEQAPQKQKKGHNVKDKTKRSFKNYPDLAAIKPREKYVFHSDYFTIDDGVATIMSFFHVEGATDNFGPFWGVNRIPSGLSAKITTITFEQVHRMSEKWLADHQTRAEGIASTNESANQKSGTNTTRGKARRRAEDYEIIASELTNGAAYLHVHYRMLVKAPDLDTLDAAVRAIERLYTERFATLTAAPYAGDQRTDLSELFQHNERKIGHGFYFTSTEFAGSYSLVTHGIEDYNGEYVGYMLGDVNNSAVLFDVDGYHHHCIVANEGYHEKLGRQYITALWGSKMSQSCMLHNHRVVHLIMDGTDLDKLGPKFDTLTTRVNMNRGDMNMFEMFGEPDEELSVFPAQMQKLTLMAEQAYTPTDSDRSIIRGSLQEIATKFYIDQGMWRDDAKKHRDRLRVLGIPHSEVPTLSLFVSYLETAYKASVNGVAHDNEKQHALGVLRVAFRNMLQNNGDLFETITSDAVDNIRDSRRVIYDFSSLLARDKGVAMAQFVNIIAFAVGKLGKGDAVIIHGAENLDAGIKDYINLQFERMYAKGARVCYLYNNIDKMLLDRDFCMYDKADYMIFGNMTDAQVRDYTTRINQQIPPDLTKLITTKGENISYIRRGMDNVVFRQDLMLGIKGGKAGMIR